MSGGWTPNRNWIAINPVTVARECSEAHVAFLIADAKQDIALLSLALDASRAREAELVEALRELWRYGVNSEVVSIEEYHSALDRTADLLAKIDGDA